MKARVVAVLIGASCIASGQSAWAKYPTDVCPKAGKYREVVPLRKFQQSGERLVQTIPPVLTGIPNQSGIAGFHVIVLIDGTAFVEGADHVTIESLEASLNLQSRFQAMRYKPPRLAGRPVCVGFDVEWRGENPQAMEINLDGMYR